MQITREAALHSAEGGNIRGPRRRVEKLALTEKEKSELLEHFQHRTSNLKAAKTTLTSGGQILAWVDIESQHPKGQIATPPPHLEELHIGKYLARIDKLTTFELQADIERG